MRRLIAREGHRLNLDPQRVDRERLLGAIAMAESSGGRNWQPNFEPAFYVGGSYWNDHLAELANLWEQGADPQMREWSKRAVACSWGPWQVLYVTAEELGYHGPPWGLTEPAVCLEFAIRLINRRIAPRVASDASREAVAQVAGRYNAGGNWQSAAAGRYIKKILRWYEDPGLMTDKLAVL